MTFLEFVSILVGSLMGSAVFQFFQAKSGKNDVDKRVFFQTTGTLLGLIGAFALLSYFFLPDREIRRMAGIGIFIVVIVLFHLARIQLKKTREQSNS